MTLRRIPNSEEWLAKNRSQMIDCPYQPGRLRLSREACQRRTLTGHRVAPEDDGLFLLGWNNLLLCRKCPIGMASFLTTGEGGTAREGLRPS